MNFANKVYGICLSERALKNGMTYNHLQTKEEYRNFLQQEIDNAKSTYNHTDMIQKKRNKRLQFVLLISIITNEYFSALPKKIK